MEVLIRETATEWRNDPGNKQARHGDPGIDDQPPAIGDPPERKRAIRSDVGVKRPKKEFIKARAWAGPKKGYVFKSGDEGLGYYRDEWTELLPQYPAMLGLTPVTKQSACEDHLFLSVCTAAFLKPHAECPLRFVSPGP